jgi:hypothetical protein
MPVAAVLATAVVAFAPAPGWHARSVPAAGPPPPCALSATVPLREVPCEFPHKTVAALPLSGIAIWAVDYGRGLSNPHYEPRRLPLRLAGTPLQHNFEGLACSCGFQQILARVHGRGLWVMVIYGRTTPSRPQRARAAAEVARLAFR